MFSELTLRTRIIVAAAIFGAAMGTAFAVFAYFAFDLVEESFVEELLTSELDAFTARYGTAGPAATLSSAHLRAYVEGTAEWDALPTGLQRAPVGFGELRAGARDLQFEMRELDGRRLLMVYDETTIETTELMLGVGLTFSVVILTIAATWFGYAASRRLIEPVTRLAGEVRALGERGGGRYDVHGYADDEVGLLARAFADHHRRIGDFLEREREFTGQTSHELRTPLTVIRAAVDLVLADPALTPVQRARLERARRGAIEMGELVDALLVLARDRHGGALVEQDIDVRQVVEDVAREIRGDAGPATVAVVAHERPVLRANRSLFAVVVRNLAMNAVRHGGGDVTIEVESDRVVVSDRGPGLPTDRHARGGLGLSIVERLCERHGWRFDLESVPGAGTRAAIGWA